MAIARDETRAGAFQSVRRMTRESAGARAAWRLDENPWPWLTLVLLVAGAVWIYAGRGLTFSGDEWDFVWYRRPGGLHHGLDAFLEPHVQHPVVAIVAYYRLMWP